jgi:hypothetical protein
MMFVMVGDKREEWTYIRVVYTLNTDRSEDLLNPIFSPFHLFTIDSNRLVLIHILNGDLLGMDLSCWIIPIKGSPECLGR